ncbi:OmpA family protein [Sphingomicrobium astaxanthinifaciens]|uniref:OmpA family protein n=1 Tax=Sphingomicrobium astaxanthinifaciens TaxID=1227949 RepID=UPI001FCA7B20|nr:OmpA family protein [Sphingomicrobium astaxanthinifaciens]MCJ7420533.1 OmpA family protein [Sphingomicrobium astaxanthinifaciens]
MTPRNRPASPRLALSLLVLGALAGCREPAPAGPEPEVEDPAPPLRSIIREDIASTVPVEAAIEVPMEITVGVGAVADGLDPAAREAIDAFLGDQRIASEEPITLFGHSDSVGSDAANARASRARAQLVADYLEARGVDPERLTIVALGEHNPVAPNFTLAGEPDPEGQARNRRVEIAIGTVEAVIERRALEAQEAAVEAEAAAADQARPAG